MSFDEKSAWIMATLALTTYAGYVAVVLGRADGGPLSTVPYAGALLWAIGISVAASVVLHTVVRGTAPDAGRTDQRDRQIGRFGEHTGQWLLVAGAIGALVLALLEADHFWIANTVYLGFTLAAAIGSTVKIVAYRRGFHAW